MRRGVLGEAKPAREWIEHSLLEEATGIAKRGSATRERLEHSAAPVVPGRQSRRSASMRLLFAALSPDTFTRASNLAPMRARQTVVVAIAAVGMTLVIVLGGIDLSVGSGVALATVIIASLLKSGHRPAGAASLGGGIAAIGLAGALVGTIVTRAESRRSS